MRVDLSKKIILLSFVLIAMGGNIALAKKMYRWVDDKGNIYYSDQVPPEQVQHRRESLNENARVVDIVEKEKTKAQRELEKRLSSLRKQQDKIIAKQKAHDKVLLSTFRNLEDMKMAMKGKMLALDGQRNVVQGNLVRFEKQLQQQQKKAAQFERDGVKVPKKLLNNITTTKEQIELAYVEISRQFEKKKRVGAKFESDIARFIMLTDSRIDGKDVSKQAAETKAANELGLYFCETVKQCDIAWEVAKQFVDTYSTTELDIETVKLIMSRDPFNDADISLSVSKLDVDKNKQQLFLDVRCRKSSLGDELCRSGKAKKIRRSFSGYIKSAVEAEVKALD